MLSLSGADSQPTALAAQDAAAAPADSSEAGEFHPALVLPTYNNARTLPDILERAGRLNLDAIVVNDGSTDATAEILDSWTLAPHRRVVSHPKNRGKAAALRSGFAAARETGFTHAVTLDTDGQLAPEDVPALLEAAQRQPHAMILGLRDDSDPSYPARSRVGRRISNFLVRAESGASIEDSQCGLRVYPLELIQFAGSRAQRFAFETEILTRVAWAGGTFVHVAVTCRYLPPGERVSHFRPWMDTFRSIAMHGPLVARALWPWPHRKWKHAQVQREKNILRWLNPLDAWRDLRHQPGAAPALAVALAVGVFIANLPLYGVQALLALYAARRLRLNPLATVLGTQVSTPPVGPVLIAGAIAIGHLLRRGALPVMKDLNVTRLGWRNVLGPILLDWTVGGLILGFVLAIVTYFASAALLKLAASGDQSQPASI